MKTNSPPVESKNSTDHQSSAKSFEVQRALQLALKLHQSGNLPKAETIYKKILKTDPQNADALHLLGMIAHNFEKYDLAINLIRRAASIDAGQPMFYNNLGNVYRTDSQFGLSAECFKEAIQICPEYAEAHYGLGKTRQLQGRLDEAIEAYSEALRLNTEMTEAIINLGQVFQSMGVLDKAIACYERVKLKNPDNSAVNLLLASAYLDQTRVAIV